MKKAGNGNVGVFPHTTGKAAFVDRIEMNIWGIRRSQPKRSVSLTRTFSIASAKSVYSQATYGLCSTTGNRFQLRYGVMRWRNTASPFRLICYSDGIPTSYAEVMLVVLALFREGARVMVSRMELTFDLLGTSVDFLKRRVTGPARRVRVLKDESEWRTLYVGSQHSDWQLRVYDKTRKVTRFELILRRGALRKLGIERPHEVVFLRQANLGKLVLLREVDQSALPNEEDWEDPDNYQARVMHKFARDLTAKEFVAAAKACPLWRNGWLQPCAMEKRLRRMQDRLVW